MSNYFPPSYQLQEFVCKIILFANQLSLAVAIFWVLASSSGQISRPSMLKHATIHLTNILSIFTCFKNNTNQQAFLTFFLRDYKSRFSSLNLKTHFKQELAHSARFI